MLIIGVVALIFTVVMVSMLKAHKSILTTYLQNFTGILFIFSGWVKAVDPMGTAFKMVDYFTEFEATFKETAMSFIAPIFPYLSEHALAFAIFMIIFEIILGIMLLLGDRPKLTSWLFFLLVLFFTVLTGFTFLTGYVPMDKNFFSFSEWTDYVSTNMRVTDCGCFGDFIKLDPKISFFKDLFLMIPAIYFLFKNGEFHQLLTQKSRNLTLLFSTFFLILYCIYNFYWDEPHVDFRPFRNGANIAAIQKAEKESSAAVQVLTMRMKNKKTGVVKNIPYGEYMRKSFTINDDKFFVITARCNRLFDYLKLAKERQFMVWICNTNGPMSSIDLSAPSSKITSRIDYSILNTRLFHFLFSHLCRISFTNASEPNAHSLIF